MAHLEKMMVDDLIYIVRDRCARKSTWVSLTELGMKVSKIILEIEKATLDMSPADKFFSRRNADLFLLTLNSTSDPRITSFENVIKNYSTLRSLIDAAEDEHLITLTMNDGGHCHISLNLTPLGRFVAKRYEEIHALMNAGGPDETDSTA